MNTNHYPSLELCKKLTEIGFPETEHIYAFCRGNEKDAILVRKEEAQEWKCYTEVGKCPSVMEMLDVMPREINGFYLRIDCMLPYVSYNDIYGVELVGFEEDTIPNALAEMILWLHENKYITFPTP